MRTPGALFQKVISENRFQSGLREAVDSFYENLTAVTERDGTLSEPVVNTVPTVCRI